MNFEDFMKKMKAALEKHYGDDYNVRITVIKKNNNLTLHGISVIPSGPDRRATEISPTVYLEEYYRQYEEGICFGELVQHVIDLYEKHRINVNFDMNFFLEYNKVKDRIVYKLINYKKNKELLEEIPHIRFLDMAVVFYYYMENEIFGTASILIYNTHLHSWKITSDTIYDDAKKNTPVLLKSRMRNMEEIMLELLQKNIKDKYSSFKKADGEEPWITEMAEQMMDYILGDRLQMPMYVLSNESGQYGAASILYPKVLEEFSRKMECSLYILPSSVHEVILIMDKDIDDPDSLKAMVEDVNRTQLAPEEVLSDHVYYYSRTEGKIEICGKRCGYVM